MVDGCAVGRTVTTTRGEVIWTPIKCAWRRAFLGATDPRPIALMRIGVGAVVTWMLAERIPVATQAYSDHGWIPHEAAVNLMDPWHWSVLHHAGEPWQVTCIITVGALAAALFTVGLWTRAMGVLTYAVLLSVHVRNPVVLYGGDLTGRIFLFYLVLSRSGAAFSVDAVRTRIRQARASLARSQVPRPPCLATPIPVWPVRLLQIQIATIYLMTGISKSYGTDYHDGTALWYALANPVYSRLGDGAEPLYAALMPALVLLTQITLWWEVAFAFMVPFGRLRPVALGFGLLVHGGIFVLLKIEWWGPLMMLCYLSFLPGKAFQYRWLRFVRKTRDRRWHDRLELGYDPEDETARALVARVSAGNAYGLVKLVPLRDLGVPWRLVHRETGALAAPRMLLGVLSPWPLVGSSALRSNTR